MHRPHQGHTAGEGQLRVVRAWTLVATQVTIVQVLCVPVQEEEGEGLAPRDTRPLVEAAYSPGGLARQSSGQLVSGGGVGRT